MHPAVKLYSVFLKMFQDKSWTHNNIPKTQQGATLITAIDSVSYNPCKQVLCLLLD